MDEVQREVSEQLGIVEGTVKSQLEACGELYRGGSSAEGKNEGRTEEFLGREKVMFDRFGELNSAEDINELAENLFNEGDLESIKIMAEENGISQEYVEMYLQADIPMLCDALTAAMGKLDVECEELKPQGIMEDWVEYLRAQCMEDEVVAVAVRKKGKSLKGCIGALLKWSFAHQKPIDQELLKAAGVTAGRVTEGTPGMRTAKKLIREYYLGGKS